MVNIKKNLLVSTVLAVLPMSSFATDGYFQHGYGVIAQGMGGAATAATEDAMGGANNPASMVWVGNHMNAEAMIFSPKRKASRTGNPLGLNGSATSAENTSYCPVLVTTASLMIRSHSVSRFTAMAAWTLIIPPTLSWVVKPTYWPAKVN